MTTFVIREYKLFQRFLLAVSLLLSTTLSFADYVKPKLIRGGVPENFAEDLSKLEVIGVINLSSPSPDCGQMVSMGKFRSVKKDGAGGTNFIFETVGLEANFEVYGQFSRLKNADFKLARNYVKANKRFLLHYQTCGDSPEGYLVNIYNI